MSSVVTGAIAYLAHCSTILNDGTGSAMPCCCDGRMIAIHQRIAQRITRLPHPPMPLAPAAVAMPLLIGRFSPMTFL